MKPVVLAAGPHPDDIEIGCGGTLIKLSEKFDIHMLVLTEGDAVSGNRRKEQEKSAGVLNAAGLWWGNYKDTDIPYSKELIMFLEEKIRELDPVLIFTNYYRDTHQDHRALANNIQSATRYSRNVLYYEVPTSIDFTPSVFTNIERVWEKKKELLRAHSSQVEATRISGLSILESAEACAIFRGYQGRSKYSEGFIPLRLSLDWTRELL